MTYNLHTGYFVLECTVMYTDKRLELAPTFASLLQPMMELLDCAPVFCKGGDDL